MKKTFVLLAGLAASTLSPSFAQTTVAPAAAAHQRAAAPKTPEERAGRHTRALVQQLGLSAEQQPKVESILQAQMHEIQGLKDNYHSDNYRRLAPRLKATKAKYDEQLKAVLTPEQFARLEQLRQERRQQLQERRNG